jgi:adenylate cyclase
MPHNIEIKAKLSDFPQTLRLAAEICGTEPEIIRQEDVFFCCAAGRLKLRIFSDGSAELIAYHRPDQTGPKTCSYVISPVPDPRSMRETLSRACGVRSVVRKRRQLFLAGRTRIHLDQVEGLGDFLELEVVMDAGEHDSVGVAEANELIAQLQVPTAALIDRAYVDLIESQQPL